MIYRFVIEFCDKVIIWILLIKIIYIDIIYGINWFDLLIVFRCKLIDGKFVIVCMIGFDYYINIINYKYK